MGKFERDLRLVPNETAQGARAVVKAHLAKHGYGDIDVNMTGGYDPTTTVFTKPPLDLGRGTLRTWSRQWRKCSG